MTDYNPDKKTSSDVICSDLATGDLIYTLHLESDLEFPEQLKDALHIIFVKTGRMVIDINQRNHSIESDTVICINSHSQFRILDISTNASIYCVYVKTAFFGPEIRERISHYPVFFHFINYCSKNRRQPCSHLIFNHVDQTVFLLFTLLRTLNINFDISCAKEFFLSLIAHLSTQLKDFNLFRDTPYQLDQESNHNILDILDYLYSHYQTINLVRLANHFHYSPNYLSNLIRQSTKMTFGQHLTQKRLSVARYLLETTNRSVNHIIQHIGYEDKSSFYRQFVKEYQDTPLNVRKKYSERKSVSTAGIKKV